MAKNIKYSPNSGIRTYRGDGTEMLQCVLLADEAPASLEISGADVEGLNDDTVIAAGSTLITPSANYIAFGDGKFAMKSNSGGSVLPAVTSDDNGKMLTVVDGAWAADDKRFVVTLTPTAADYSGTMDKTVGEIREAWQAGKSIYFYMDGFGYFPLGVAFDYFMAYGISVPQNAIVVFTTDDISDHRAYVTKIYQLTPLTT